MRNVTGTTVLGAALATGAALAVGCASDAGSDEEPLTAAPGAVGSDEDSWADTGSGGAASVSLGGAVSNSTGGSVPTLGVGGGGTPTGGESSITGGSAATIATGGTVASSNTGGTSSASPASGGNTALLTGGASGGGVPSFTGGTSSSSSGGASSPSSGGALSETGGTSTGGASTSSGGASGETGGTTGTVSTPPGCELGYTELPNGADGMNVEQVCWPDGVLNREASLVAFETTVYPLLRENCAGCHSTATQAQAPIHSDSDVNLAHEYALTRVNFRHPEESKFVVRMGIDRHNCFGSSCSDASSQMLAAVQAWAAAVEPSLPPTPAPVPLGQTVSESEVLDWIAADRAAIPSADAPFIKYVSLHEIHNAGASADHLNVARVGLSKILNSVARWAPTVVNPTDINGLGLVYRFDARDYWGYNKGVAELHFGGSDDDLVFGSNKTDVNGNPVDSSIMNERYNFDDSVSVDANFANIVWTRILYGNIEGAVSSGSIPANVDGFHSEYVEASQLIYTLSRPDVYNAIMAIPWYATELEEEVGVIVDQGMDSYDYVVTHNAITVDSRLYYRARLDSGGFYWKTFDIFTGQDETGTADNLRFPFWKHPIPKFVSGTGFGNDNSFSFIATLWQPTTADLGADSAIAAACDPQESYAGSGYANCRYYTGSPGLQQSAEEVIWTLPNGLQGYALFGAFNQRRVDAFTNIVRDYRILRSSSDANINSTRGFTFPDLRLNEAGSCMGCHVDGMNRGSADLRDWLESGSLPAGEKTGSDSWINDAATVERVRELYPTSAEMRPKFEDDRRLFLEAMWQIRDGMVLGENKNVHVEPIVWSFEWAQQHYAYEATRSN